MREAAILGLCHFNKKGRHALLPVRVKRSHFSHRVIFDLPGTSGICVTCGKPRMTLPNCFPLGGGAGGGENGSGEGVGGKWRRQSGNWQITYPALITTLSVLFLAVLCCGQV